MARTGDHPTRPVPDSLSAWRVCPVCAGDLEPAVDEPGAQPHVVCHGRCGAPWYANPKPTGNLLVERADDGRLMLVRRGRDPFFGMWDLPGGFIEEGEEPQAGAIREIREETGLEVRIVDFVGVFIDEYESEPRQHTMNMFWRAVCENPDSAVAASDVSEIGWFLREEIPPADELAFDCVPRAIALWEESLGH
ncbi:MAG: NUDIX domain-containing protein [Gaiellales bacterium]